MKKNYESGKDASPIPKKLLLVMKLTALLIFIFTVQVTATVYSQSKKLSIDVRESSIKEVLQKIEAQSEYRFIYENEKVNLDEKVSINVKDELVENILKMLFGKDGVSYSITGNNLILISPSGQMKTQGKESGGFQQQKTSVKGKVTDSTGGSLPGVSVVVKGTTNGTITDVNGDYMLSNVGAEASIQFSFVGMKTQEIKLSGRSILNVTLADETVGLEEVVAVGYGTQKKENLTGAVSQVKMEKVLGDRPIISSTSALQGAIPGLQINSSPQPGQTGNTLNIRGTLSINGGAPLVLIDGAPGSLSMLNPDDIETISVLKDAASAAIYGAQAAGGVILINTKHPKAEAQFKLDYSTYYGFETSIAKPLQAPLLDYFQAYTDAGLTNTYWSNSQNITKWVEYLKGYKTNPSNYNIVGDGIYVAPDGIPYYLNEKDLYKNFLTTGISQTHNVSASGGTKTVRYRISAGYNNEDGPLVSNKDTYKRYNAGALITADITDWFTQEINVRYAQSNKNMLVDEQGGLYSLRLISYYPEGNMPASLSLNKKDTPLITPRNIIMNSNTSKTVTDNPHIMFKSVFKPTKDLKVNVEYTYDRDNNDYSYFSGKTIYTSIQLGPVTTPSTDYYIKRSYFTNRNALNVYGNYTKTIGDHNFSLMAGFNQESSYYEYVNSRAEGQAVLSVPSFGGATGVVQNTDSYSEFSSRSGFYRFNYNYKNKYLLETNGRYDGSSKFPKTSRFGFFPSVSLGWQLGKENFMGFATPWVQELKLRGSYGSIGNQAIDPYQYSPDMAIAKSNVWSDKNQLITTIGLPSLVSKNFTWETITTLDFGADFGMLKNRLTGTFDWYQRDTRDMLTAGAIQLPATVGASAPTQNSASMRTRGWELSVNWNDKIGKVSYRVGLNIYDRKSVITKYDNNQSGLISDYYVGKNLGEIWGYLADGYYSINDFSDTRLWKLKEGVTSIEGFNVKPGDIKFKNLNDDSGSTNQIDPATATIKDPGDRKIIGNTTPRYQFGFNLGANYGGFDLNVLLQGVGKRDYWLSGSSLFPFAGAGATDAVFQPIYYNQTDYWKPKSIDPTNADYMVPVNPDAKLFRIYNQMENVGSNTRVSDKYLQNAAYLRIKNITLSYTFKKEWVSKLKMQQLKLFTSVENLVTFSSLPKGFDPESLNWSYPFYRTVSFGASVTF